MDLWVTIGVLVKRWYITLPLLALVGLAAVQIGNGIEPTYTATATGRVYCPEQTQDPISGEIVATNRFCADRTTADLAVAAGVHLNSRITRVDVKETENIGDYVVDDTDAPLLYITAESEDEDEVIATLNLTMAIFSNYVEDQQTQDVFPYTAGPLDVPIEADGVSSSKTRTQIIIAVAGVIIATIAAHVFDAGAIAWRRRRDDGGADEVVTDEPEPEPDTSLAAARRSDDEQADDEQADDEWEQAKKKLDDEVEKITSESGSRWGR